MKTLFLIPAALVLGGCAVQTPNLDGRFGMAQNTLKMQQALAPQPPAAGQALTRLDGAAGKEAFDNYVKSFHEATPQAGALSIGVGR
jgi:hypothetical protein